MDYYVPRTKDELVKFFVLRFGYHVSSLRAMGKAKLYAIYHKVMRQKLSYSNFTTAS